MFPDRHWLLKHTTKSTYVHLATQEGPVYATYAQLWSTWLTLELRLHLPGVGGEGPEHMALGVSDEQQGGTLPRQARHHPGEALSVQLCGEQEPPGGTVAIWQLP